MVVWICDLSTNHQHKSLTIDKEVERWDCEKNKQKRWWYTSGGGANSDAVESRSTTSLQLRFQTQMRRTYFTGNRIESEHNSAIRLDLGRKDGEEEEEKEAEDFDRSKFRVQ
ncbi:hypothetical protein Tco_1115624 [Tanacetum coccineum]